MILLPPLLAVASVQIAAAAAAAGAAAEPVPALIHVFGDWSVACDNGNRCAAVSLVPEAPRPLAGEAEQAGQPGQPGHDAFDAWERFAVMRLERAPGPDGQPAFTIFDFAGTPARLTHFGEALDVRIQPHGDAGTEWRIVPADEGDFVARFSSEPIVVQDAAGKTLAWIATAGAPGAMAYMDERQGRVRTVTALGRPGPRPAGAVPPGPVLPVVEVARPTAERPLALSKAQLNAVRRRHGCESDGTGGIAETEALHALGDGRTLIMMSCGAGAYNLNVQPLIAWAEGGGVRIETAPTDFMPLAMPGETPQFFVTNAEFDPATMGISGFAKGRGLGDCGVAQSYAWDGTRFRLVEQQEMSECRGTLDVLTTWRAETR